VGKALVMTHDYKRAVKYYETCLRDDPKLLDLRTDLADLYIKLRAFDDSKRVLIDALKYLKDQKPDIDTKAKNVQYLLMMSKVFLEEDMQQPDWHFKENIDAKQALIEARALQTEVIDMCRELSNDRLDTERTLAAEISFKIGKYLEERDGNVQDSVVAYNDCLSKKDDHKDAIFALARLFQNMGNNDQCTAYCHRILKIDPSNDNASFMLANLMLMREKSDDAINIFIQLLEKKPDNFNALAQLIELLRRAGRMTDV
jgi:tetratricopeptide repeat protein 21B